MLLVSVVLESSFASDLTKYEASKKIKKIFFYLEINVVYFKTQVKRLITSVECI